jgi:HAMP domain-containing protein
MTCTWRQTVPKLEEGQQQEPRHQEFAELCALAMVGDASAEELARLRDHLRECQDCRREYREFTQLVLPQLQAMENGMTPRPAEMTEADSARLRSSFLARAQAEGIAFSPKTLTGESLAVPPKKLVVLSRRAAWSLVAGIAACLFCAVAVTAKLGDHQPARVQVAQVPAAKPVAAAVTPPAQTIQDPDEAEVQRLAGRDRELEQDLKRLKGELADAEAARVAMAKQLDEKTAQLNTAQADVSSSQESIAGLRSDVTALRAQMDLSAAAFRDDQAKLEQLTVQATEAQASLDRERQMLDAGREMRDMMAARNLHIVDVVDTDANGKNRPAFGRIFFAENRRLVFYAYDLNETKLEDARFDYRIWGQKEGQPHTARSLGVFYTDDKTQRRWVFQCDDPKTLSEIDSVFVTLEPVKADPNHPRGPQLMYAYLRGQPNHP